MRTTPEIQTKLRERLQRAVEKAGSADALGRLLGWANGGPVRLCLSKTRPRNVTPEFVFRSNDSSAEWLHGWFDGLLPPVAQVDLLTAHAKRQARELWPFKRLSAEEWGALGPDGRAVVEDVARSKARELLAEATAEASQRKRRRAA